MLTLEGCLARRSRLWNALPAELEWVLIADPRHVQYLANFLVQPLSFSGGERAWLLLERGGKATLLGDNFSLRSRTAEPFIDEEIPFRWYDHQHSVINRDHALLRAAEQVADRLYGRSGAVEAEWFPIGAFESLALDREQHSVRREAGDATHRTPIDLGTTLRSLRRQKLPDEVALLRKCMQAGAAGQQRAREIIRPGLTELDVYREVQSAAIAAAGTPALVYGDFRVSNAEQPKAGGLPTGTVLKAGDLFVLDYSVVLGGYRSDFTNAIAVTEPTAAQQALLESCQAAMSSGEQTLRAGVAAKDVFAAVEGVFLQRNQAQYFGHHAGHGIGLAHPEAPILVRDSTDTLLAGDVITLEPGLYVPGVGGIRIEHNYLITDSGYERLSDHTISLK